MTALVDSEATLLTQKNINSAIETGTYYKIL